MKIYPDSLERLINYYKKLPGIGEKNAERMALTTVNLSTEEIDAFAQCLQNLKRIQFCSICGHISDNEICNICNDKERNKDLICVMEDSKSVFAFEKSGHYNGVYHVLSGLISPIEGISPDDINIANLMRRVKASDNPELIISLKSTIEGETTLLYLKKIFEKEKVTVSRLSYGIPIGAEIDYLDSLTIDRALADRKKISE